jgi:hypothetical protein
VVVAVKDRRQRKTKGALMRMRAGRIAVLAVLTALLLGGAVAAWWIPSEAELARRVAQAASERLGVKVNVGALHWHLLPRPRVVVENAVTEQRQPMRLDRLTLVPSVSDLLARRVKFNLVTIDGGVVATRSLHSLNRGSPAAQDNEDEDADEAADTPSHAASAPPVSRKAAAGAQPAPAGKRAEAPNGAVDGQREAAFDITRFEFRNLTWISRAGTPVEYEGELDFEPGLQLQQANIRRPGLTPATDIAITRLEGSTPEQQRFNVKARVGGGRADGDALVRKLPDGSVQLTGQLAPTGVEVQGGLAAFNRSSPVAGRASGRTLLQSTARSGSALFGALHTDTTFTMAPATLVRFDLDRAIKTLGREHQGQTTLEQLTGRVETQNSRTGMGIRFSDIKARSGSLTASGEASLKNRYLKARAAVDVVDGVVGVPLRIEGPMQELKVSVAGGAIAGAVAGTAVLPGIGTVIGAAIGRVFSRDGTDDPPVPKDRKPPAAPASKAAAPTPGKSGAVSY